MGPLSGLRVVEIASAAPAPFACMVLSDLGAEVLRIDRPSTARRGRAQTLDPLVRGRQSVAVDLKSSGGSEVVRRLVAGADVLVEGFRPGVMERLGLGPDDCAQINAQLIYARMTGWGQSGPLAARAGHDINYIALAGALEPLGRAGERPLPPLNLVADFGGGGMLLVVGVLAALHERTASGRGQIVDAAMVDGTALLTAFVHGMRAQGIWSETRGENVLGGAAPFYDTYVTADGGYVAVGALERKFYDQLLAGLGLAGDDLPEQLDRSGWPQLRARFAQVFLTRTRDEWAEHFATSDACVSPVLSPGEAPADSHLSSRETFVDVGGLVQPAPAPRFSRTPPDVPSRAPLPGADSAEALARWGFDASEVARLVQSGCVVSSGGVPAHAAPAEPVEATA
ncbi:MAG TPA: CaiB/BaiF CoA-transferase family protein [Mycobacteriales bacterium]|nr:CaiB/BaiF CoA-transferase family protein [Mycobacteriales bacterium]